MQRRSTEFRKTKTDMNISQKSEEVKTKKKSLGKEGRGVRVRENKTKQVK